MGDDLDDRAKHAVYLYEHKYTDPRLFDPIADCLWRLRIRPDGPVYRRVVNWIWMYKAFYPFAPLPVRWIDQTPDGGILLWHEDLSGICVGFFLRMEVAMSKFAPLADNVVELFLGSNGLVGRRWPEGPGQTYLQVAGFETDTHSFTGVTTESELQRTLREGLPK